jgi:nucleoside-diphosphate-sugar epimerase
MDAEDSGGESSGGEGSGGGSGGEGSGGGSGGESNGGGSGRGGGGGDGGTSRCLSPGDRVLVTGAGGMLGRAVLAHLAAAGTPVTALVLEPGQKVEADRVVLGDARDVAAVRKALDGAAAVVHLAAIPSPEHHPGEEVFGNNALGTFTVLEQAGLAGLTRAVIASSYSVTGLPFAPRRRVPAYLPVDESLPVRAEDPYALSKQVDEATAAMMWWRHGLSVLALRFPFLGGTERLAARAAGYARDPAKGARELWSYLDLRDAARACELALHAADSGYQVIGLAAPLTLAPYPTAALLDAYLPDVPRRMAFPGRRVPLDLGRAEQLLSFRAEHELPIAAEEFVGTGELS